MGKLFTSHQFAYSAAEKVIRLSKIKLLPKVRTSSDWTHSNRESMLIVNTVSVDMIIRQTRQAMYALRNIEGRFHKQCCRGKVISIV